jgi:hypothetical protein
MLEGTLGSSKKEGNKARHEESKKTTMRRTCRDIIDIVFLERKPRS